MVGTVMAGVGVDEWANLETPDEPDRWDLGGGPSWPSLQGQETWTKGTKEAWPAVAVAQLKWVPPGAGEAKPVWGPHQPVEMLGRRHC